MSDIIVITFLISIGVSLIGGFSVGVLLGGIWMYKWICDLADKQNTALLKLIKDQDALQTDSDGESWLNKQ